MQGTMLARIAPVSFPRAYFPFALNSLIGLLFSRDMIPCSTL